MDCPRPGCRLDWLSHCLEPEVRFLRLIGPSAGVHGRKRVRGIQRRNPREFGKGERLLPRPLVLARSHLSDERPGAKLGIGPALDDRLHGLAACKHVEGAGGTAEVGTRKRPVGDLPFSQDSAANA